MSESNAGLLINGAVQSTEKKHGLFIPFDPL